MTHLDRVLAALGRGLKTVAGGAAATRPNPASEADSSALTEAERSHAAGLMRVNHCGEVCAQALYEGQAILARDERVRSGLAAAAAEEQDHLAWCRERLDELDSRPSVFDPVFYAMAYAIGVGAGSLGDRVSLGFVEATEDQVGRHLDDHLTRLPPTDERSRAILEALRTEERRHGDNAQKAGAVLFPGPVKAGMALASKVMIALAYRI